MFKKKEKELTGINLLWDNLLNTLIDNGELIEVKICIHYIFDVTFRYNDHEYYIKNNYQGDNIYLDKRQNKLGEIEYGCAETVISSKTYKKFFKKLPELIAEYRLKKYKDIYQ